ncbi:MAG: methionyl-tRNA formyltransferase [Lachnospiraceae bacterium]|nr:methionyl-tRNA formyltransferase [Lachnospiraceae bacterium]
MRIIIATVKSWNIERAKALQKQYESVHDIVIYTTKEEYTIDNVRDFNPDYIFMPHWSYLVSNEITDNYECVVFHMTDLPYGRGGSPLQNLIVRGHKETKISAIKVTQKLDGGPVYMKRPLSLEGSAQEIFVRCADIIFREMLPVFLSEKVEPKPQEGEPVVFKRRKPEEGRITPDMELDKIYDYIRMLDAEGYPRAYMEFGGYRLEFEQAGVSADGQELSARVIFKKQMGEYDENSIDRSGAPG